MNTVIFRTVAPLIVATMLVFSVYICLRGHNEPGGGFIGGLIAASAIAILGMLDQEEAHLAPMGTLKTPITREEVVNDPNVVKVVTDHHGNAIYFSRSPIPHVRQPGDETAHYKHIGLYIYQRDFLLAYPDLPIGPLEQAERLEQLRALENGFKIRVVETDYDSLGVDTPEDWRHVTQLFEHRTATVRERTGEV